MGRVILALLACGFFAMLLAIIFALTPRFWAFIYRFAGSLALIFVVVQFVLLATSDSKAPSAVLLIPAGVLYLFLLAKLAIEGWAWSEGKWLEPFMKLWIGATCLVVFPFGMFTMILYRSVLVEQKLLPAGVDGWD